MQSQISKSLKHFAKHLFVTSKVYRERESAREEVYSYLQRMKKSIIRMNLSYSEVDRLRQKIDRLILWERKYSKFFRTNDPETDELKNKIKSLEDEILKEKEEKSMIKIEQDEKIRELSGSLENIKDRMKHLLLDKAKRNHRLKDLEQKISKGVDRGSYFNS